MVGGRGYLCSARFKPESHRSKFPQNENKTHNFPSHIFSATGMSVGKHTSLSNGMRVKYLRHFTNFFRDFSSFRGYSFAFSLESTKFGILEFARGSRSVLCVLFSVWFVFFFFARFFGCFTKVHTGKKKVSFFPQNSKETEGPVRLLIIFP